MEDAGEAIQHIEGALVRTQAAALRRLAEVPLHRQHGGIVRIDEDHQTAQGVGNVGTASVTGQDEVVAAGATNRDDLAGIFGGGGAIEADEQRVGLAQHIEATLVVQAHAVQAVIGRQVDGSHQPALGEIDHADLMAAFAGRLPALDPVLADVGIATLAVRDDFMGLLGQFQTADALAIGQAIEAEAGGFLLDQGEVFVARCEGIERIAAQQGQGGTGSQQAKGPAAIQVGHRRSPEGQASLPGSSIRASRIDP